MKKTLLSKKTTGLRWGHHPKISGTPHSARAGRYGGPTPSQNTPTDQMMVNTHSSNESTQSTTYEPTQPPTHPPTNLWTHPPSEPPTHRVLQQYLGTAITYSTRRVSGSNAVLHRRVSGESTMGLSCQSTTPPGTSHVIFSYPMDRRDPVLSAPRYPEDSWHSVISATRYPGASRDSVFSAPRYPWH